jgi:hypothetical protein
VGRISRRAADEIKRTVQIVKGLAPGGSGFAPVGPLFHLAKTTTTHASGEIEDVDIYVGTKGEEVDSGQTVKAYNRRGSDIDQDEWIHIQWVGDGWDILGGGGGVTVIGPCATYTPELADPDTDFAEAYPGGCDGPDVLGVNVLNVATAVTTVKRMELESTGPLVLSTDAFTFNCKSGSLSVYIKITFTGINLEEVVANVHLDSDDSIVQGYTNTLYSWDPLSGGNLQMAPDSTSCDCGTLPFNLCFSVPTR